MKLRMEFGAWWLWLVAPPWPLHNTSVLSTTLIGGVRFEHYSGQFASHCGGPVAIAPYAQYWLALSFTSPLALWVDGTK